MQLDGLLEMSHRYGRNEDFVLAGGGNTSYKEDGIMYVKGSGTSLADMNSEQFVGMDLNKPGFTLAKACLNAFGDYAEKYEKHPKLVLLKNHGVFVAADSVALYL